MSGFNEGVDRSQASVFPERLEDWICEHGASGISSQCFVEALHLRLSEPGTAQPSSGTRGQSEC